MLYRKLGRTGREVSVVGLGAEHLEKSDRKTVVDVVSCLLDHGGNYIDLFMASPDVRNHVGAALAGRREAAMVCGHIGAAWVDDQYLRTRDPAICRHFVDDLLRRLDTGYLDVLMIHFVDTHDDLNSILAPGGLMEIAQEYRKSGVARAIGLSSHMPSVARRAVETGLIDVLMYPVNPVFDSVPGDRDLDDLFNPAKLEKHGRGSDPARSALYDACERQGTAIVTMKTYCAGWLLDSSANLDLKLTPAQCIQYALDQPAVASALAGCHSVEQMEAALRYCDASAAERDYAEALAACPLWNRRNSCMYCNHCLPCPVGIDIAETTRLLDRMEALGEDFDPVALRIAYAELPEYAGNCITCGDCEARCPFHVEVIANMRRAAAMFGQ